MGLQHAAQNKSSSEQMMLYYKLHFPSQWITKRYTHGDGDQCSRAKLHLQQIFMLGEAGGFYTELPSQTGHLRAKTHLHHPNICQELQDDEGHFESFPVIPYKVSMEDMQQTATLFFFCS